MTELTGTDPLYWSCYCGAAPGTPCVTEQGTRARRPHIGRRDAADRFARYGTLNGRRRRLDRE